MLRSQIQSFSKYLLSGLLQVGHRSAHPAQVSHNPRAMAKIYHGVCWS